MGFFSYITVDTNRSISNKYSNRGVFTVYLIDNEGNKWREDAYEGYGIFGGKDIRELEKEMTRKAGGKYTTPILAEDPNTPWSNHNLECCEFQGYFYPVEPCIDNIREDVINFRKKRAAASEDPELLAFLQKIEHTLFNVAGEFSKLEERNDYLERRLFVAEAFQKEDDADQEDDDDQEDTEDDNEKQLMLIS